MKREPTTPADREGIGCWSMMSSGELARACLPAPPLWSPLRVRLARAYRTFSDIPAAWAKDEPPTPTPDSGSQPDSPAYDSRRNADNASYNTDSGPPSRWWTFVLPRAGDSSTAGVGNSQSLTRPGGVKNRSMTWVTSAAVLREAVPFTRKDGRAVEHEKGGLNSRPTVQSIDTGNLGHHTTSGLQSGPSDTPRESSHAYGDESDFRNLGNDLNEWPHRRKSIRNFILVNPNVPLVCPSLYTIIYI